MLLLVKIENFESLTANNNIHSAKNMEIKNFTITKRDGSKDRFSLDKIMNAIIKAFNSVNEPTDLGCISKILANLDIHEGITVEDIQNQVEESLMKEGHYAVAKSSNFHG